MDNIVALIHEEIQPFLARTDYAKRNKFYDPDQFRYDASRDVYHCPQGHILTKHGQYKDNRSYVYSARAKACRHCPVRDECTTNKRGRTLHRSFFQIGRLHIECL